MSKITFRADDDLVERVERLDASKSEVMRRALRAYLDSPDASRPSGPTASGTLDALVAERVDALVDQRLRVRGDDRDINLNITLPDAAGARPTAAEDNVTRARSASDRDADGTAQQARSCAQCGESVAADHVYCPNCGEKQSRRVFCECGDEVRTDWSFCPSCGRRTPAADVLDRP